MNTRTPTALAITLVVLSSSPTGAQEGTGRGFVEPECSLADEPGRGVYTPNIWPAGEVPYRFNTNVTAENQQRALDAMAEIEAVCNVDFVPWMGQTAYVFINAHASANNSCIGYSGGVCTVNIASWESRGIIIHEFGHSLGLYHEHQRPDRDTYVQVSSANICSGSGNFPIIPAATPFGPYDFESIMHYGRRSNSRDGSETISVRPAYAEWKYFCGQRDSLSNGDIWVLTHLYGGARPPRSFPLIAPAHRAPVGAGWTPCFEWGSAELADSYHLQVDDDASFASPEIDVLVGGTTHCAETPLADGRVYSWRVLAVNATGETEARPRPVYSFFTGSPTPSILYVDDISEPGGTGASWSSALRDLGDALTLAEYSAGQTVEVRVAQGTYRPDGGSGDRERTFRLTGGVHIKGGYAGVGTPDPDQRDASLYPTVLTGDLAGNDQPGFVNYGENSLRVVSALGVSPVCTLEGLTITAGNADGVLAATSGGGVSSRDSQVVMVDCRVTLCSANIAGGGVRVFDGGSIEARGTLFEGNRTTWPTGGGGAGAGFDRTTGTAVTLIGCTFRANTGFQGAGVVIQDAGPATLRDCLFEDNVATQWGGGVEIFRAPMVVVDRCTFSGNRALAASDSIAGAYGNFGYTSCNVRSTSILTNCLFEGNSAGWTGGAISNADSGTTTVVNCTFAGNAAAPGRGGGVANIGDFGGTNLMNVRSTIVRSSTGGQIVNIGTGATTTATYSNVEGGWPGTGNIDAEALFVDSIAGDYRLGPGSACIDAGSVAAVPAGLLTDLAGEDRFRNDTWRADTGAPDPARPSLPVVDMGAHEFQGTSCPADFNNDASLNSQDFFDFLGAFFGAGADFNGDGASNSQDFFTRAVLIACASLVASEGALAQPLAWRHRTADGPQDRQWHAMAYDSARGVTVLFGGSTDADTWEWDGTSWTQRLAPGPSPRSGHAMAYDSARGVTVLFSGWEYADTWEWDGTTWTERVVAGPPPKFGHAMAYDSARGVTVLAGTFATDAWEWDGESWTPRVDTPVPVGEFAAMAYDSARGVTVLVGGSNFDVGRINHLEWDGTNWTQPNAPEAPSARAEHAMTYDAAHGITVLYGGVLRWRGGVIFFGDTWKWDGGAWIDRNLSGPGPGAMVCDAARDVCVHVGEAGTWELGPACPADVNADGYVNSQDCFHFLAAFFGGEPTADFNADQIINTQDFFDFLAALFAGC